jgi:HEAT repeat protein
MEQQLQSLLDQLKDKDWKVRQDAAIALGKLRDDRAIESLVQVLQNASADDEDEDAIEARISAVEALGEIGDPSAVTSLLEALEPAIINENISRSIHWFIIDALGQIRDVRAINLLIRALELRDTDMYKSAKEALIKIGAPAVPSLLELLSKSPSVLAIRTLGGIGDSEAVVPLTKLLKDKTQTEDIRDAAATALGQFGGQEILELLLTTLDDEAEPKQVRGGAAWGLGYRKDNRAIESLIRVFENTPHQDYHLHMGAAFALGNIRDSNALEPLMRALKSDEWPVRTVAARALGHFLDSSDAITALLPLVQDKRDEVCMSAIYALGQIGDSRALSALLSTDNDSESRLLRDAIRLSKVEAIKKIQQRQLQKANFYAHLPHPQL